MTRPFASLAPVGAALVAWPSAMGAAVWLVAGDASSTTSAIVCALPALAALALAFTSPGDRRQYVARLLAAAGLLPLLSLMWADGPQTPGLRLLALAVLQLTLFVAAVAALATAATRVGAVDGAAVASAEGLGRRLRSLTALGLPLRVVAGEQPGTWRVDLHDTPERAHCVLLSIDAAKRRVVVRERLGVMGAVPRDADEAAMRGIGDVAFDAARPRASQLHSRTAQATMIVPERLEAVTLQCAGDQVLHANAGGRDAESTVTLLAALVTRSGYEWRPVLFARGG